MQHVGEQRSEEAGAEQGCSRPLFTTQEGDEDICYGSRMKLRRQTRNQE